MQRLLTALVLIPVVLIAVFRAPASWFDLLVAIVAILASMEYLDIAAAYGYKPFREKTFLLLLALFAIGFWATRTPVPSLALIASALVAYFGFAPFVYLCAGMAREDMRSVLPGAALSYFALPYIGFSLLTLVIMKSMEGGWFFLLFTFCAVWIGDTAAYYVGRSMGRFKFAPAISPKKTWEGAIASILGAVIIGVVLTYFGPQIGRALARAHLLGNQDRIVAGLVGYHTPLWLAALAGGLINVAAQVGDLVESLMKRGAGVKDSGNLLPGHGGMLDRIDALLFASPVALLIFAATYDKFIPIVG